MKLKFTIVLSTLYLTACAESFIKQAETAQSLAAVSSNETHFDVSTLAAASEKAAKLSYTYTEAARKVSTVQDAASAILILSAAATVYGGVKDVGGEALARRALPGIGAGIAGRRYASRATIEAIYTGARRLNCVSTKAGIANAKGVLARDKLELAAVVATRGAIHDIQIMTREGVLREVAKFDEIFKEFSDLLGNALQATSSGKPSISALDAYILSLHSCLAQGKKLTNKPGKPNETIVPELNCDDPKVKDDPKCKKTEDTIVEG